jgi:hypothetical protein
MIKVGTKLLKPILALGAITIASFSCNVSPPNAGTTTQPLSQTSQVKPTHTTEPTKLIVGDISELQDKSECNNLGDMLIYAETKNYFAYICGSRKDTSQPAYFKAKPKNEKRHPSIIGKAYLGWQQLSFVGISDRYTYSLSIPLIGNPVKDYKPSLNIYPFSIPKTGIIPEEGQSEEFTKYLSIEKFRFSEFKKFDRWWWSPTPDPLLDPKKKKFIKYLMDNRESLKVCEDRFRDQPEGREEYSTLYRFDSGRYLLQLRCSVYLKYNSFNFFLISEQNNGLQVKFLAKPYKVLNDNFGWTDENEGRVIYGRPLYDPQTKTLSIQTPFSATSGCGSLITYDFPDDSDSFRLLKYQNGNSIGCEKHFYIDPILYPQIYP